MQHNTIKKIIATAATLAILATAATAEIVDSLSSTVYRTPSGKKFHLSEKCGGANSYSTTLDEALTAKLDPCGKCAKKAIIRTEYNADGEALPNVTVSKDAPTDEAETWLNDTAVKVIYTDKDGNTIKEVTR